MYCFLALEINPIIIPIKNMTPGQIRVQPSPLMRYGRDVRHPPPDKKTNSELFSADFRNRKFGRKKVADSFSVFAADLIRPDNGFTHKSQRTDQGLIQRCSINL